MRIPKFIITSSVCLAVVGGAAVVYAQSTDYRPAPGNGSMSMPAQTTSPQNGQSVPADPSATTPNPSDATNNNAVSNTGSNSAPDQNGTSQNGTSMNNNSNAGSLDTAPTNGTNRPSAELTSRSGELPARADRN